MSGDVLLSIVVVALVFLAAVASGLLAVYSFRRIDHPLSESYGTLIAIVSLWAGGYLLMLVAGGTLLAEIGLFVKAVFSALAAFAWLRFVSEYTGDSEWLPRWLWGIGIVESVVWGGLVLANPSGLVIGEVTVGQFGVVTAAIESGDIGTSIQLLIAGALVGLSLLLLGRFFLSTKGVYRYQVLIITPIAAIVFVSMLLFATGYRFHPLVDPTPILFNIEAIGVGWALYRYDFLRVAPVSATRFFSKMDDPVLLIDGNRVVTDFNAAATELIDGLKTQESVSDIDNEAFSGILETALDNPGTSTEYTTENDSRGKRVYDIKVTQSTDQFDITRSYIVVLRDITDRKQREQELEEFVDIVSHDLRNPLGTAKGWAEAANDALEDGEPDVETALMTLDHVDTSHERMAELIEVLLTMARQGQTVDDPDPVSLADCASDAWETADTGEMKLAVETDQTVAADRTRLRQAFENLFRNATDHSEASRVTVTDTADGFAVTDDGDGIDDADRESLFEFGYSTDDEGTGIGLAVVRRIIEAHGWRITAGESDDGGAYFEITGVAAAQ